ncbi:kinesin motor family protein, partial [Striga asiatica]
SQMAEGILQFNVASMVEDILQQHRKRLDDIDLASRKAQEASLRRYDAASWLRKTAGVVAAKDLPAEPSEDDFRLGLRSGIILCNVLNKIEPGAVTKVVETPPDTVIIPDGAALTAYQYFENVRNFLVAIEEIGIPIFEASDLEQGVSNSLHVLVRELLSDKSREEIPLIVESMLSKVMEEIAHKVSIRNEVIQMAPWVIKDVPSSNGTEEMEDAKITPNEECSKNITQTDFRDSEASENHSVRYSDFVEHQERSVQELKNLLHTTKQDMKLLQMKYQDEVDNLGKHLNTLAIAANGYKKVLEENRRLYNQVQDLKGNIRVYCRVRPFLPGQANGSCAVEDISDNSLAIVIPSKNGKTKKSFTFNKCFGPCSSQEEVFADTQPLIRSVLDGYNVCIFAYGQTGSGKTFTMTGPEELTKETLGVNYRALSDLFQISEQRKDIIAYDISVQMTEIYNEQVRDLLATDGGNKKYPFFIRNNCSNGINVPNANLVPVASTYDVINLMNLGHKNRAVGSTLMNDRSSRSHSCLTVHVQGRDLTSGAILRGCMHLVDLAGSERLDKTEAIGDRLKEAQHINRSLSALGDVISSLALKQSHIPYRNSKLTQLLQDSLAALARKEGDSGLDRQGIKSSGSSPSHFSWDSVDNDACKTESLDLLANSADWPPLIGSLEEKVESPDEFYQKSSRMARPEKGPVSRRHSLDNGLGRVAHEYESAQMDDNSDSSEADYSIRKSQIPQPIRRVSNGIQATSAKSGRQLVYAVGKRKPTNG